MSEKNKSKPKATRIQYGALPYRWDPDGLMQIMVVTSRGTGRWILPKGWPTKGVKPPKSAAREAFEEAGVRGSVGLKSIGSFTYEKRLDDDGESQPCEVHIFPLLVERQHKVWPEALEREARWTCAEEALDLLDDSGAKDVVAAFVSRMNKHARS